MPRKSTKKPAEPKPEHAVELHSLRPGLEELERAIDWVAARAGIENQQRVVPTIQTTGKKANCYGWFMPDRWSTKEGELCHEMTFCAEHLSREPESIVASVVHETVHLWCHAQGLKDVSKSGYHNKVFKKHAEQLGLECAPPMDGRGHAYTRAGAELLEDIEKDFQPDVGRFNLFRVAVPSKPRVPSKMKKWQCGCTTVRCATELVADCEACGQKFEQQ
ncbi:MAG: hypothetical protein GWN86_07045 [Desulfobacterales bacterium]|nr:hypothetical protein [Desulfobacterales bacterium]